jgi:hypothetical protein
MINASSSDLEPALAKMIALGDVDPGTLLPMEDINPGYVPRGVKALPLVSSTLINFTGKGKAPETSHPTGLLNFFGCFFLCTLYVALTVKLQRQNPGRHFHPHNRLKGRWSLGKLAARELWLTLWIKI